MPEESMHIRDREGAKIIDVNTNLGRYEADDLKKTLGNVVSQKVQNIVVNLSQVEHINSTSIGVLVGVAKQLREKGGNLNVYGLADNITRVFDLIGASDFIEIFASEDSAFAQSKNSGKRMKRTQPFFESIGK